MKRARGAGTAHSADAGSSDPTKEMSADELRADIERTRQDLSEAVEGLAAKADVKARALRVVDGGKQAVSQAPVKAARTARMTVDLIGLRRLLVGVGSAAIVAGTVWTVARGVRARRARNCGFRRFLSR